MDGGIKSRLRSSTSKLIEEPLTTADAMDEVEQESGEGKKVTEIKAALLDEYVNDNRHFSLVRNFHLADFITLGNGACGSLSIFTSMRYLTSGQNADDKTLLWIAMGLMPLGMLLDFLDGKVARWRRNSSLLGQELDSLADLITFGVAPAALAFTIGFRTTLDVIVLTLFICCGIARLARYNATTAAMPKDATGKVAYFEGTPIPSTLLIVAGFAYLVSEGRFGEDNLPGGKLWEEFVDGGIHPLVSIFATSGIAMVSKTLKVPKF